MTLAHRLCSNVDVITVTLMTTFFVVPLCLRLQTAGEQEGVCRFCFHVRETPGTSHRLLLVAFTQNAVPHDIIKA